MINDASPASATSYIQRRVILRRASKFEAICTQCSVGEVAHMHGNRWWQRRGPHALRLMLSVIMQHTHAQLLFISFLFSATPIFLPRLSPPTNQRRKSLRIFNAFAYANSFWRQQRKESPSQRRRQCAKHRNQNKNCFGVVWFVAEHTHTREMKNLPFLFVSIVCFPRN